MEITRQSYMTGEISHAEYYRHIAKLAGIAFTPTSPFIQQVKNALANGDEHLNTISLMTWDLKAAAAEPAIRRAMKQIEGEFYSFAGGVCVMKQAAIEASAE